MEDQGWEDVSTRTCAGAGDIASGGAVTRNLLIRCPASGCSIEHVKHVRSREKSDTCEN